MTLSIVSVQAQTVDGLAIQIGFAAPTLQEHLGSSNYSYSADGKTFYKGFKVGLFYDATIIRGFGVTMGLNYTMGANITKWDNRGGSFEYPRYRTISTFHSLEIPVDWQYKFEVASNTYIIVYTGPTIQVHLGATDKAYYQANPKDDATFEAVNPLSAESMAKYGYEAFTYNRYNVLWGVGAGFQYDRFFLRGGYDFGLINSYKNNTVRVGEDNINIRSRFDQWQVKIGVYLWSPSK